MKLEGAIEGREGVVTRHIGVKSRLIYPSIYQDKPLVDETILFKDNPARP